MDFLLAWLLWVFGVVGPAERRSVGTWYKIPCPIRTLIVWAPSRSRSLPPPLSGTGHASHASHLFRVYSLLYAPAAAAASAVFEDAACRDDRPHDPRHLHPGRQLPPFDVSGRTSWPCSAPKRVCVWA